MPAAPERSQSRCSSGDTHHTSGALGAQPILINDSRQPFNFHIGCSEAGTGEEPSCGNLRPLARTPLNPRMHATSRANVLPGLEPSYAKVDTLLAPPGTPRNRPADQTIYPTHMSRLFSKSRKPPATTGLPNQSLTHIMAESRKLPFILVASP